MGSSCYDGVSLNETSNENSVVGLFTKDNTEGITQDKCDSESLHQKCLLTNYFGNDNTKVTRHSESDLLTSIMSYEAHNYVH